MVFSGVMFGGVRVGSTLELGGYLLMKKPDLT